MVEASRQQGLNAPTNELTAAVILDYIDGLPALPVTIRRLGAQLRQFDDPSTATGVAQADLDIDLITRRLGEHTVSAAAVATFAGELFERTSACRPPHPQPAAFWHHAFKVAAIAELINDTVGDRCDRRLLFMSALLHDVGKLVMDHCMPKAYARVVRHADIHRLTVHGTERAQLGIDHAQAGQRLTRHWGLPEALQMAIGSHHHPPEVIAVQPRFPELAATVQLANVLAGERPVGHPGQFDPPALDPLCARIGTTADVVRTVVQRSGERAEAISAVLSPLLHIDGPQDCEDHVPHAPGARCPRRRNTVAPAEPDVRTQRWLKAMADFAKASSHDDRAPQLCGHVANCLVTVLQIDTAVAFIANPSRTIYYCGVSSRGRTSHSTIIVHPKSCLVGPDEQDRFNEQADPGAGGSHGPPFPAAPALADPVQERFRRVFAGESQLMMPLGQGEELLGGVLVDADTVEGSKLHGMTDALDMLQATFAAATVGALRRLEAEQISQAQTDANQRLREMLPKAARSRSLTMIAQLAAGAAHELNTPLAVISGRAQILAQQATDPSDRRMLETICDHCHKCSLIVSELVAFAKPEPPRPRLVALKTWLGLIRDRWMTGPVSMPGEFTVSLADPAVCVWADPAQLDTILDALISNAAEAMTPGSGRLVINSPSRTSDETVVIAVQDNGQGMTREVLELACDPFFSHRVAGRGRGLGLSIAQRLVEINGGRLWPESSRETGTTVFVELPAREPSQAQGQI